MGKEGKKRALEGGGEILAFIQGKRGRRKKVGKY